ncbi:NAD+ synthase [Cyanobium sp. Alchichica 3B3-8F6]|uniref:NAD+ synthase n=1 Tax=Cyanobium sp. Alchichica 3B3-8F6 TaxID=2823696 RepID=UPI0020CF555D|nr:NAD+ synthase [Cyanobium sp. Alchichica 3B3-8F6]MCP9881437.1 NAD+ synthase [Cyanobium sp. Alchichica 3B3-8F6]
MRLALAQLNPLVGDLAGNGARILAACHQVAAQGASLVVTPELSLWGYPPRDLLLRPSLITQQGVVLQQLADALAEELPQLAVLVGIAEPNGAAALPNLFNAVALVEAGSWRVVARKRLLPTYDVFDEQRYFCAASEPSLLELEQGGRHWRLGLTICEDLWVEEDLQGHRLAGADPVAELLPHHIDLLLNLSASPFGQAKVALRQSLARRAATRLGCPVVYVNQVGGNDELVFDGASFVVDPGGGVDADSAVEAGRGVVCQLACGREQVLTWDPASCCQPSPASSKKGPQQELHLQHPSDRTATNAAPSTPHPDALLLTPVPEPLEQLFRILVLGVADYARKCGFHAALLGLSGGIDSALVAVIAAAALGGERVQGLLMPSPWSSEGSLRDAQALAARLGLTTQIAPIAPLMAGFDAALTPVLAGPPAGLAAENLQSRIRGTLLMAVANQQGQLLLSTGNKSELAVGYCTLYGDMNGGLAVIGDLYKTTVFALCAWLDSPAAGPCRRALGLPADGELVGQAIREKPPSAELRPDQRDSDSLPDYAVLDPILRRYIEHLQSPEELIADGTPAELAHRVMALLRRAEFKRRQAPPLLKIGSRSFGSGWRMPIAAANLEGRLRS